jgi:alkylation response protein AidB-like acyl-CoA dehydrogenase
MPGTIARNLTRRAGDLAPTGSDAGRRARAGVLTGGGAQLLIAAAKSSGATGDPLVRQDLAHLHTLGELGRFNNLRLKAARAAGGDVPGIANLGKLMMSQIVRLSRDVGLRILGPLGTLHAYDEAGRKALDEITANPLRSAITEMALFAQAPPIYGGTDQIQRNIIGERVLGLPKEPSDDKTRPFAELPKNA